MAIARITITMSFDTSKLPEPPEGEKMPTAQEILAAVAKDLTSDEVAEIIGADWDEFPGFATCVINGEVIG